MGCDYRDFCSRHRDYLLYQFMTPSPDTNGYTLDMDTVAFQDEKMTATLNRNQHTDINADQLLLEISLYQDGIIRFAMQEPDANRFRIS